MLEWRVRFATAVCSSLLFACATARPVAHTLVAPSLAIAAPLPAPVSQVAPVARVPPAPPPDPVVDLLARSNRHFELGSRELADGHLAMARTQFDRALEVLMEPPSGARSDPRLREQFERLVARISAHEVAALAQGDGFAEQRSEPARIDELLAVSTFEEPRPTTETTQAVAEDLEETPHNIEIPLNARVLSYVQLFTGRLKGYLEEGLNRGSKFLPMIQDVFRAEGLPLDLAYIPLIESAFKPNALSRAKAKGMWQFMKGTGIENGLKTDWYIDERSDPEKATRAAARYLKVLYGMFGDWHLALASYNGGPGRLQRAIKRSPKDDFWSLSASRKYLPRETRDYVPLILAAVVIAKNPLQYGMSLAPLDDPLYETVTLPTAVDLRHIAEWSAVPVQTIQDLNPELRRWTTPLRVTDYELKVPAGTADFVRAGLLETAPEHLAPLNRHTVKKGETLATVAKKLKVSKADLAEANYLSTRSKLKAGQQLVVPRRPATLLVGEQLLASAVQPPSAPLAVAQATEEKIVHRVKRGESLFAIAKRYGTTVSSLQSWNRIRGSAIQVGQRIIIFPDRTVSTD